MPFDDDYDVAQPLLAATGFTAGALCVIALVRTWLRTRETEDPVTPLTGTVAAQVLAVAAGIACLTAALFDIGVGVEASVRFGATGILFGACAIALFVAAALLRSRARLPHLLLYLAALSLLVTITVVHEHETGDGAYLLPVEGLPLVLALGAALAVSTPTAWRRRTDPYPQPEDVLVIGTVVALAAAVIAGTLLLPRDLGSAENAQGIAAPPAAASAAVSTTVSTTA